MLSASSDVARYWTATATSACNHEEYGRSANVRVAVGFRHKRGRGQTTKRRRRVYGDDRTCADT